VGRSSSRSRFSVQIAVTNANLLIVANGVGGGSGPFTYRLAISTDAGLHWSTRITDLQQLEQSSAGALSGGFLGFQTADVGSLGRRPRHGRRPNWVFDPHGPSAVGLNQPLLDVEIDSEEDERPERDAEHCRDDWLDPVEMLEVVMRIRHDQTHYEVDRNENLAYHWVRPLVSFSTTSSGR
jgi:hypothetical protein